MSSNLKAKSEKSFQTAQLLIDNQHFNCSVHSAYYACIQIMKYILKNTEGLDEASIQAEQKAYASSLSRDAGFHAYIINRFVKALSVSGLYDKYRKSIVQLTALRNLRNDADYSEIIVEEEQATKAFALSEQIISDLKFLNGIR